MTPARSYNERSWAIDLIGYLKQLAANSHRSIRGIGGECSIRASGRTLFPDVLLFGDRSTARILQGWELKMPDTNIGDIAFRRNAEEKAKVLGLDSFLLWNVSIARLFVRIPNSEDYIMERAWSDLSDISSRQDVIASQRRWQQTARDIFSYMNDLFDRGVLKGRPFVESYRSGGITALVMENADAVEDAIDEAARRNALLRAKLTVWWNQHGAEYLGSSMPSVLARTIIGNWIAKILFAHILRERDSRAWKVSEIGDDTTPSQALQIFRKLSQDCNFWTIFSDSLGLSYLPDRVWSEIKQFNQLLADLKVGSVSQHQLAQLLETTVQMSRRRLRGQYPTPLPLAGILAKLCLRDVVSDRLLDPCCGSGTIPRAALEQKLSAGVPKGDAVATVFAGDLDQQATQIATLALADPRLMNESLRIFQKNAFSLKPSTEIQFTNPVNGSVTSEQLGTFQSIACNLPFVSQTGRSHYAEEIQSVSGELKRRGLAFSGRADLSAYLPFALYPLLADRGRFGAIITNAWLGTNWGDLFYDALVYFYDLRAVITSGCGRWFRNSDIVTNVLIMERKNKLGATGGATKFIVMKRAISEFECDQSQQTAFAEIELGQSHSGCISIRSVDSTQLSRFRALGLGGNAQFVNSDWILDVPMVPISQSFDVRRGERRGNNAMFYPAPGHGIEQEYICPLIKGPTDFVKLTGTATREAFSCSRTLDELRQLKHSGALNWIQKFSDPDNVDKLRQGGSHWYEMKTTAMSDLVMFINYGDRLFVGRLQPPAFVDQRLVRFMPHGDVDIELIHALMNCSVGMFVIEGMGFGRGQGALDLSKNRIGKYMHMLNPKIIDRGARDLILREFEPLLKRPMMNILDELKQPDRHAFDLAIAKAFGIDADQRVIYDCLKQLVHIRSTASE